MSVLKGPKYDERKGTVDIRVMRRPVWVNKIIKAFWAILESLKLTNK